MTRNGRMLLPLDFPARDSRVLVVLNPAAGQRRSRRLWRVLDVLVGHGVRVDVAETCWRGHGVALAREAAERGVRIVVAAGGDGTVAEVVNGLAGSGVRLGIVLLGTANVLAQELRPPADARSLAAALVLGRGRARCRAPRPGRTVSARSCGCWVRGSTPSRPVPLIHVHPADPHDRIGAPEQRERLPNPHDSTRRRGTGLQLLA